MLQAMLTKSAARSARSFTEHTHSKLRPIGLDGAAFQVNEMIVCQLGKTGHGAGDGIRTRDINLGKVALYQLSYSRLEGLNDILRRVCYEVNSCSCNA